MKTSKTNGQKDNWLKTRKSITGALALLLVLCFTHPALSQTQRETQSNPEQKVTSNNLEALPTINAANEQTPIQTSSTRGLAKNTNPSGLQVRAAAAGITNLVMLMGTNGGKTMSVKVPHCNYAGVLQELQNNHAQFLLPGADAPANAKAVFNLETEHSGLRQTVYFM